MFLLEQTGRLSMTKELVERAREDVVFEAPPLDDDLVRTIRALAPHTDLSPDEESRKRWELDQNASCFGELEALGPLLGGIPTPRRVLELGPGLGRSAVFFSRKLGWRETEWHFYDATGDDRPVPYTTLGPRSRHSFYGDLANLERCLRFNGLTNYRLFDAKKVDFTKETLPGPYDVVFSLFAIGFHWSLRHFLDDVLGVMGQNAVAFFTVPNDFEAFDALQELSTNIVACKVAWPENATVKILTLRKERAARFEESGWNG
jgi:hypothetical protein